MEWGLILEISEIIFAGTFYCIAVILYPDKTCFFKPIRARAESSLYYNTEQDRPIFN